MSAAECAAEPPFDPFWFQPIRFGKWWWQQLRTDLRTIKERGGWSYVLLFAYDWFLVQGYLLDWLVAIGGLIFSAYVPLVLVKPNEFYVDPGNPALAYPRMNSYPMDNLNLYMWMFPVIIIALASSLMLSWHDFHTAILGLVWTHCIGCNFKQFMNLVGCPRPYWFAVNGEGAFAQPSAGSASEIQFARQSFPSGHAAYSMQAMTFIFCYLMAKFRIMQNPGPGHLIKALVAFSPLMVAFYVAMMRITHYMHHPVDVVCGLFIGSWFGVWSYFIFYPNLWHACCWLPTPRRAQLAWEARAWEDGPAKREQSGICVVPPGAVGFNVTPGSFTPKSSNSNLSHSASYFIKSVGAADRV